MKKCPIMQSGFISFSDEHLQTPVKYNDLVISNVLSKDYRSPSNRFFFNQEITRLYNRWLGDPNCLKDFDTREELLKIAKLVFETPSFFKWIKLQTEHAQLGDLHVAFLTDTLEYLSVGERRLQVSQWISLLEKAIKSEGATVNLDRFFDKELYGRANGYDKILPSNTVAVIARWTGWPRGFEDLLISLFVIFGNRPYITDVSENPRA